MSDIVYRLIREMKAEAATRDIMATKEPDLITRNSHIHIAGLLRRAVSILRGLPKRKA